MNGRAFKPTEWSATGLPIVRIQNLNNPAAAFNRFNGEFAPRHYLAGGELLFAWSGTPGTSFGAHLWKGGEALLNQHIFRVDFDEGQIDKRFFRFAINQKLSELIDVAHGGAGLQHVTKGVFEATEISLPSRGEQQRIADKLDNVLARVDACRDGLDRVATLLKRFRQSVLAAATSGRLTDDWREANPGLAVDASALITSRRQFSSSARDAKLLEELIAAIPPTGGDSQIPRGWLKTYVGLVGVVSNGSTPARDQANYWGGTIPWVSSGEVRDAEILQTRECISQAGFDNSSVRMLPPGAVLIAMIGEGKTRGQSALLSLAACINQNVAGVVVLSSYLESRYLWRWFQAQYETTRLQGNGTGPQALNCQRVREIPVNLPPLAEQLEIVRRVETLFAVADRLEARLTQAQTAVDRLTPSLLAKAFRGELVPQDPADEPAAELLKRLAPQRDAAPARPRRQRATA